MTRPRCLAAAKPATFTCGYASVYRITNGYRIVDLETNPSVSGQCLRRFDGVLAD
jgi:hypothetical protein